MTTIEALEGIEKRLTNELLVVRKFLLEERSKMNPCYRWVENGALNVMPNSFFKEYPVGVKMILSPKDFIVNNKQENYPNRKQVEEKWNNTVIKVLSKEHGEKVIEFWKEKGVDTSEFSVLDVGYYYGYYDGIFCRFKVNHLSYHDIKIITLPKKFPEKWYMICTHENKDIGNAWRRQVAKHRKKDEVEIGRCFMSYYEDGSNYSYASNPTKIKDYKDYVEITYEEFLENVYNPTLKWAMEISKKSYLLNSGSKVWHGHKTVLNPLEQKDSDNLLRSMVKQFEHKFETKQNNEFLETWGIVDTVTQLMRLQDKRGANSVIDILNYITALERIVHDMPINVIKLLFDEDSGRDTRTTNYPNILRYLPTEEESHNIQDHILRFTMIVDQIGPSDASRVSEQYIEFEKVYGNHISPNTRQLFWKFKRITI